MTLQKYITAAKAMHSTKGSSAEHAAAVEALNLHPHEIAALLLEADALLPKWRPIEEAPRDGTPVLGYMPSYYQDKGGQSVIVWLKDSWYDNRAFKTSPTHFMPLLGAPK